MKTVSTLSITMSVPLIMDNTHKLVGKVFGILAEIKPEVATDDNGDAFDGNNTFYIVLAIDEDRSLIKNMKLISAQIITAPNQVPSLQLGFMV
jgi:hypothetical protein